VNEPRHIKPIIAEVMADWAKRVEPDDPA